MLKLKITNTTFIKIILLSIVKYGIANNMYFTETRTQNKIIKKYI